MPKGSECKIDWKGLQALGKIKEVLSEALWLMGQDTIREAQNMVPLDTGTLRRSATVSVTLPDVNTEHQKAKSGSGTKSTSLDKPAPRNKNMVVYVSYNTPYALWLHETPTWKPRDWKRTLSGHKRDKPAVGEWKWLDKASAITKKRLVRYVTRARAKAGI